MQFKKIRKRNGLIVEFNPQLICTAIEKAETAASGHSSESFAQNICNEVVEKLTIKFDGVQHIPSVEQIQDTVEYVLVQSGNFEVAKQYILYRSERAKRRAEERLEELQKIDKKLLKVTKRSGKKQVFKKEKLAAVFNRVVGEYQETCKFEDLYEILKLMITDGFKTTDLMKGFRKAALDLITIENINWQHIAGRLYVLDFYKQATKNRKMKISSIYSPKSVAKHFKNYIKKGLYYKKFYDFYTETDIEEAATWIDKDRDLSYIYSTVLSFDRRYLLNPNKVFEELPQEMYLAVALFLAIPEPADKRMAIAREIYEACSSQKLSLPTPTLLNARTNYHQLSSCFKLNADDDLRSIYHQIENMAQISKFGGGVGIYLGHIRGKGADIRGVNNSSGGVIPWIKVINDTACAVNQLGARLGAISPTLDVWHRDIFDFLEMQTETGDIRSKAFDVFPAISVPDLFMQRVLDNGNWTTFEPHEILKVTGQKMENLFDQNFTRFFEECENNPKIKLKETVKAKDLMKQILKTAVETGMPYIFYRDTVNRLNPNKHAGNIYSSQLCTEICQNTSATKFIEETLENDVTAVKYKAGDTVVCNLASINMAKVHTKEDMNKIFPIAMRVLDNVITLNCYPIKESENTSLKYRSVGLGFMGLAEYLACNGYNYESQEARDHVDSLFEQYAYHTLKESNNLAKERGQYELFPGSEWSKGIIFGRDENWYQENSENPQNWAELIKDIKQNGLRFAYHLSPAPNTSTSGVVGTTAGLLPIYKKFFVETNVIAPTVTVAPKLSSENFWYYKEYPNMDMNEVINMFGVIYKWIDQSASFEWMINPAKTSPADLFGYYVKAWKEGIKTIYYVRSMSGDVQSEACESCSG